MKEMQLTQGKVALIDDEDFERLNQFNWYAHRSGNNWYAVRSSSRINGKQTTIIMHREIMNTLLDMQVDHKNGNSLDNQKSNIRTCTHQQNQFNKINPQKNNKLGIKGVRWYEKTKKFHARIGINGKYIHLGYYNVLGDADSAYRIAEEKYFCEFARCN